MIFMRALGYAKRPLLPAADNAGSRQRIICTKFTSYISLYVELRLLLELETALLVVGEGVKQRSYLDPCLRCVFAPLMTKSSRTFDPTAVLTPCTWGLTVSKESR